MKKRYEIDKLDAETRQRLDAHVWEVRAEADADLSMGPSAEARARSLDEAARRIHRESQGRFGYDGNQETQQ